MRLGSVVMHEGDSVAGTNGGNESFGVTDYLIAYRLPECTRLHTNLLLGESLQYDGTLTEVLTHVAIRGLGKHLVSRFVEYKLHYTMADNAEQVMTREIA